MSAEIFSHRWSEIWSRLAATPPAGVFEALLARWSEPHRAYHNRQHLAECLSHLDGAAGECRCPAEVALALWFHDAIYDPRRTDNEERSADWAGTVCVESGCSPDRVERVRQMVLETGHGVEPATPDGPVLLDIDLAILGAEPERFAEYDRQIRAEYAWVPEAAFREKRAAVLQGFLDRPRIYRTGFFAERLEARARNNLRRAIRQYAASTAR